MDNSGPGASNPHPSVANQQHASLIRTDQVQKLPHLSDAQKVTHTQLVRTLWEVLNSQPPNTSEYVNANAKLTQLSQSLMRGMKVFQQNRSQQQQSSMGRPGPQNGVSHANQTQRPQMVQPQSFQQLLPQIQQKVNSLNFVLPPAISKEQTEGWLPEAKLRYGLALQKQEIGRAKLAELRQAYSQRQAAGNVTQEEMQEFRNRQLAAEKLLREGSDFLTKFKEQQETYRAQQQNQQLNNRQVSQSAPASGPTGKVEPASADGARSQNQTGAGPAPHTINSAVAARNQTGHPSASQPGQAPSQAQNQLSGVAPQPQSRHERHSLAN